MVLTVTRGSKGVAITLLAWSAAFSGAAFAGNAYQGDDYSYTKDSNSRVVVCDRESDGHGVHADFQEYGEDDLRSPYRVDDPDGAGGNCGVSGYHDPAIYSHRTVEEISFKPDYLGDWSRHP